MSTVYSLTPSSLETLVSQIFTKTDAKIAEKLSGLAPNLKTELVVGEITDVESPDAGTIYIQKDSNEDPTGTMYMYVGEEFIKIGDTDFDVDLSAYVTTEALDTYKTTVTEALDGKADATTVATLQSTVSTLEDTALTEGEAAKNYIVSLLEDETVKTALTEALAGVFVKEEDVAEVSDEDITSAIDKATSTTEEVE